MANDYRFFIDESTNFSRKNVWLKYHCSKGKFSPKDYFLPIPMKN